MADRAFDVLNIDPGIAAAIKACTATLEVNFPVEINGKIAVFTGWRSVPVAIDCRPKEVFATPLSLIKMKWKPCRH